MKDPGTENGKEKEIAARTIKWTREWPLRNDAEEARNAEIYEGVEDYDPVLRAHCRL